MKVRLEDVRTENEKHLVNGQASQLLNLKSNVDALNMKQKDYLSVSALSCLDFESVSAHVGFVVDKVALGQVFSQYFGFPCQSSFRQLLHNHPHLSSGACTIGQKWPQYLVDFVPPH
jgi:hypothetical protein